MLTLLATLALSLTNTAHGQDALSMKAVRSAQEGFSVPSVTFEPSVSGQLSASLSCGGTPYSWSGGIQPGDAIVLELTGLSRGTHDCQGSVTLNASDGSEGEMPLSLQVEVLPALTLSATREDLDLEGHSLTLHSGRPVARYELEILGERGAVLGNGAGVLPGLTESTLAWEQSEGEVIKLVVTAWDEAGLPGKLELSPWSYAIPHEDVEFPSGSAQILPSEAPKMEEAWADLQEVLERYGEVVEVRLYVAGYTDTVGDAGSNQGLSERRAQAIAVWFQSRGFTGAIAFQGFGESVLAVGTDDETDEPRNRRALYLLSAEAPGVSDTLPRENWTSLQ